MLSPGFGGKAGSAGMLGCTRNFLHMLVCMLARATSTFVNLVIVYSHVISADYKQDASVFSVQMDSSCGRKGSHRSYTEISCAALVYHCIHLTPTPKMRRRVHMGRYRNISVTVLFSDLKRKSVMT